MTEPFQLAGLSLDCDDPESLARFYLGLLGGRVLWNDAHSVGIRIPSGLTVAAQRVEDYFPPQWPGTAAVHLDLAADADLNLCEQHALAIGAKPAPVQPDPRWRVLLDPAGHPFCITTRVVSG
ncbi:VOC family protein [Nocardia sp. FBN12]|uniref:VOC family protein n=1 Tax=Nocardia sp. FBN12 TaxID=3419766 RepID=UPI003D018A24